MKKAHGFTLIEMLVAVTVLACLAVMGWRGLDAILRARVALNAELERSRSMQIAFAQMQSDCAHIADTITLPNRAPLVVMRDRFILVRSVTAYDQPTQLQIVAYRLINGVLSRRESPATRDLNAIDSYWSAATNEPDSARDVVLQAEVDAMMIRTWAGNPAAWSVPGIDAAVGEKPGGMEVSLTLKGATGQMTKVFLLGPV